MRRKFYINHSILDKERGMYIADVLTIISSHKDCEIDALYNFHKKLLENRDPYNGILIGKNLKFNKHKTDEGLFFVKRQDKTEVRVERFFHEEIGRLHFRIPLLEQFLEYDLEFRKRYSQSKMVELIHMDSISKIA